MMKSTQGEWPQQAPELSESSASMQRGLRISPITSEDLEWIEKFVKQYWGSTQVVSRGKLHELMDCPGFVAWEGEERVGALHYSIDEQSRSAEIVSLAAEATGRGVGTALLEHMLNWAWHQCLRRVWLITTNDNCAALRFYQRKGLRLVAFHRDAIEVSRTLKPAIPKVGNDGIPICDELELEWRPTQNPPMTDQTKLSPAQLANRLAEVTQNALASGSLTSLATTAQTIEDGGLSFRVHVLEQLQRKDAAKAIQVASKEAPRPPFNPFLPYEKDLFVGDISETHAIVLNKYNVIADHCLLITRAFESQTSALTRADFAALQRCMEEFDGLAFYNGGAEAGASQPHKHLQLIPCPFPLDTPETSLSALFDTQSFPRDFTPFAFPALSFAHRIAWIEDVWLPHADPYALSNTYLQLARAFSLLSSDETQQISPYNFLMTRRWMMIVPRRREFYKTISVNSLGFVGGLLVRTLEDLAQVQQVGPMEILRHVGFPQK